VDTLADNLVDTVVDNLADYLIDQFSTRLSCFEAKYTRLAIERSYNSSIVCWRKFEQVSSVFTDSCPLS